MLSGSTLAIFFSFLSFSDEIRKTYRLSTKSLLQGLLKEDGRTEPSTSPAQDYLAFLHVGQKFSFPFIHSRSFRCTVINSLSLLHTHKRTGRLYRALDSRTSRYALSYHASNPTKWETGSQAELVLGKLLLALDDSCPIQTCPLLSI